MLYIANVLKDFLLPPQKKKNSKEFISEPLKIKIIQYNKFHLCTFEWNGCAFCASINKYIKVGNKRIVIKHTEIYLGL